MTIIAMPAGLLVTRQQFGLQDYGFTFDGSDSGATQSTILGPMRRTCSLSAGDSAPPEAAVIWRALVHALRGRVNHLAVYDRLNPRPKGTALGTPTASAAVAGSNILTLNFGAGQAGATLLQGDWIGVNQGGSNRQLLHVQADTSANGSGVMTVLFEPVLRVAVGAGSAVVLDRPTCLMKQTTEKNNWSASKRVEGGFSLDLMEQWF